MIKSQEEAKVAALRYLRYPLTPGVDIAAVVVPALKGKLMTTTSSSASITRR